MSKIEKQLKEVRKKIEYYKEQQKEIKEKILSLEGAEKALVSLMNNDDIEIEDISVPIASTEQEDETTSKSKNKQKYVFDDGYNVNMSNRNKVLFVIKQKNRFVHSREVAEEIHEREPHISEDKWARKVSSALSSLKRKDKVTNYSVNNVNRNTFWGAPHWLDDDGEIKEEYMYDESYVQYGGDAIEL